VGSPKHDYLYEAAFVRQLKSSPSQMATRQERIDAFEHAEMKKGDLRSLTFSFGE
jgi:hypothetical protein